MNSRWIRTSKGGSSKPDGCPCGVFEAVKIFAAKNMPKSIRVLPWLTPWFYAMFLELSFLFADNGNFTYVARVISLCTKLQGGGKIELQTKPQYCVYQYSIYRGASLAVRGMLDYRQCLSQILLKCPGKPSLREEYYENRLGSGRCASI